MREKNYIETTFETFSKTRTRFYQISYIHIKIQRFFEKYYKISQKFRQIIWSFHLELIIMMIIFTYLASKDDNNIEQIIIFDEKKKH